MYPNHLGQSALLWAGNHEQELVGSDEKSWLAYVLRFSATDAASGSGTTMYYSYDIAAAHVIMIGSYADFDDKSPQYAWLQQDLQKVSIPGLAATGHLYPSGLIMHWVIFFLYSYQFFTMLGGQCCRLSICSVHWQWQCTLRNFPEQCSIQQCMQLRRSWPMNSEHAYCSCGKFSFGQASACHQSLLRHKPLTWLTYKLGVAKHGNCCFGQASAGHQRLPCHKPLTWSIHKVEAAKGRQADGDAFAAIFVQWKLYGQ